MKKIYQIQIDLQTYPDGEWSTILESVFFSNPDDARDWCEEYSIPALPQGWDVRSVLVVLDADTKEALEDENLE